MTRPHEDNAVLIESLEPESQRLHSNMLSSLVFHFMLYFLKLCGILILFVLSLETGFDTSKVT